MIHEVSRVLNKVLNATQSCIFCQINCDQSAHFLIAKSNSLRAVLDIHPITEGHLFILSRSHVSHLEELNANEYKELFLLAKKLGQRVIEAFDDVNDYFEVDDCLYQAKCNGRDRV